MKIAITETIYRWGCEWCMELSFSLYWCGNSSCMRCELNFYIHLSNGCDHWLFLSADLNGLVQIEQLVALFYSHHCYWVSRFIGILLVRRCLQMAAVATIWSKNFSAASSVIFTWVVEIIVHHCISHRCSSYMVCDSGIGWWRISMTKAYTSLVYVKSFRNPRRWEKVNVVGILFL